MKKFVGDINIFLNALGEKQGSDLIIKSYFYCGYGF